jgi:hypothetical protein
MIQKLHKEPGDLLLDVIRGQVPLSELIDIGIEVKNRDGNLQLQSRLMSVIVRPSLEDVSGGFELYREHPEKLRLWCFLLLAETAIDMSDLDRSEDGKRLLEAIWECSKHTTASLRLPMSDD